jgi:hypothetical protein
MPLIDALGSRTIERLGKQRGFLLMRHETELAKDPTSDATGSSRSNLMAVQHTIKQMYGTSVARDVANLGLVVLNWNRRCPQN